MILNINFLTGHLGGEFKWDLAHKQTYIQRRVYDLTECGAWIQFYPNGVKIGSIIEGDESIIEADLLTYPFTESEFKETLEWVDAEAAVIYQRIETEGD